MKIREIIFEAISKELTLTSINSAINSLSTVYSELTVAAENYFTMSYDPADDYNPKTGKKKRTNVFALPMSSITRKWMRDVFEKSFRDDLYDLVKFYPNQSTQLKQYLKSSLEDPGLLKFNELAVKMPSILKEIGEKIGNKNLVNKAQKWDDMHSEFIWYAAELKDEVDKEWGGSGGKEYARSSASSGPDEEKLRQEKERQEREASKQLSGSQRNQADIIADQTISRIRQQHGKGVADSIRQEIAKSDNKLMALQKAISSRNLTLESRLLKQLKKSLLETMRSFTVRGSKPKPKPAPKPNRF